MSAQYPALREETLSSFVERAREDAIELFAERTGRDAFKNGDCQLVGHSYFSTKLLSQRLCSNQVPHRIVKGGHTGRILNAPPNNHVRRRDSTFSYDQMTDGDGNWTGDLSSLSNVHWPTSLADITPYTSYYWVEVDLVDTPPENPDQTFHPIECTPDSPDADATFILEAVSEVPSELGEPCVRWGFPKQTIQRVHDGDTIAPWEDDPTWGGHPPTGSI